MDTNAKQAFIEAGFNNKQAQVLIEVIENLNKKELETSSNNLRGLENSLIKWMIGISLTLSVLLFTVMFYVMQIHKNSIDQRILSFEGKIDQRILSFEERIDQRILSFEEKIQQSIEQNRVMIKQNQEMIKTLIDRQLQSR